MDIHLKGRETDSQVRVRYIRGVVRWKVTPYRNGSKWHQVRTNPSLEHGFPLPTSEHLLPYILQTGNKEKLRHKDVMRPAAGHRMLHRYKSWHQHLHHLSQGACFMQCTCSREQEVGSWSWCAQARWWTTTRTAYMGFLGDTHFRCFQVSKHPSDALPSLSRCGERQEES